MEKKKKKTYDIKQIIKEIPLDCDKEPVKLTMKIIEGPDIETFKRELLDLLGDDKNGLII